jgi:hypothetical protein
MDANYPTEDEMRQALVKRAEEYCAQTGVAIYTLGRTLGKGKGFFKEIANGRNFTVGTYTEVMAWFDTNWPRAVADMRQAAS